MTEQRKVNLYFLYMLCFYLIISFFILPLLPDKIIQNENILIIISQCMIIVPSVIYIIFTKGKSIKNINTKLFNPLVILLLFAFTISITPVISYISSITMLFSENYVAAQLTDTVKNPLWYSLLLMALLPAMVEEVAFRGLIYNGYKKSGDIKGAIIYGSLLFGLFHMNINQCCYAFFMAIMFTFLYEATDSLYATIIVHFMFNGMSTVIQYISFSSDKLKNTETTYVNYSLAQKMQVIVSGFRFAVYGFAMSILIIIVIAKLCGNSEKINSLMKLLFNRNKNKKKIHDYVLKIAIVLSVLVMFIK